MQIDIESWIICQRTSDSWICHTAVSGSC